MSTFSLYQIIVWWQEGKISATEARKMSKYARFIVELTMAYDNGWL